MVVTYYTLISFLWGINFAHNNTKLYPVNTPHYIGLVEAYDCIILLHIQFLVPEAEMSIPVIGWEQTAPVPNGYAFNDYLNVRGSHLFFEDLDLAQLLLGSSADLGLNRPLTSPLEIVYLPRIRQNIAFLRQVFAQAIQAVGYPGKFLYAYASKANAAEEVVRTVLNTGVNYEISSAMDVEILSLMKDSGHLKPEQIVICNGFKQPGTLYARNLLRLRRMHAQMIPVVEDGIELDPLLKSGLSFEVGLRQKSYGSAQSLSLSEAEAASSRFGMPASGLWQAAETIAASSNLQFKLYHAMVGSQITDANDFINRLRPFFEVYAQLRQKYPSLQIFDYGGGVPGALTLNGSFDYRFFATGLLTSLQEVCARYGVPVPDVMGEMGRYTASEQGAHLFKVLSVKEKDSPLPWYIIDGSIMSSLPDVWALGEQFITLPLNHLDRPFRQVKLGGLTCDSDDIYPPHSSQSRLYLPVDSEDLYLGFFAIGAYQEMLGGAGGSKHCVIPEANELLIERDSAGTYQFQCIPGQNIEKVLGNLGYKFAPARSSD